APAYRPVLTHAEMLRRGASSYGDRVAVSFQGRDVSYRELDATTNRLARGLLASGLHPGERVVWIEDNHLDFLFLYYATAKAGLAFSPLNPRLPASELGPLLDLLEPRLVVAGPDPLERLAPRGGFRVVVHRDPASWSRLHDESD